MANSDDFSPESQMNARRSGEYHRIAANTGKCVFCDLRPKYILREDNGQVLTVNIFPYIDGQLVIVPRRHVESVQELRIDEWVTQLGLFKVAIDVLREQMGIEGEWMVIREGPTGPKSGKTVAHYHMNIMPYKDGLNTWHNQEITVPPLVLANRLRPFFGNERT